LQALKYVVVDSLAKRSFDTLKELIIIRRRTTTFGVKLLPFIFLFFIKIKALLLSSVYFKLCLVYLLFKNVRKIENKQVQIVLVKKNILKSNINYFFD
jgi:hypothetical protein